jgi:hypothetical protein
VELWLAGLNPDVLRLVERAPLGAALGHERMFFNLRKALDAWQGISGQRSSTEG